MAPFGIEVNAIESRTAIAFAYFHPLSAPHVEPYRELIQREAPIEVSGKVALRFAFLEGEAIIHADAAVYDPQGTGRTEPFRANGSTTSRLAVVLNENEALSWTHNKHLPDAGAAIIATECAQVVVVKCGVKGAVVFQPERPPFIISAYFSNRVFKIGTGDIFSAAFAYYWGEKGLLPEVAGDLASRSVAWYAEKVKLPLPDATSLEGIRPLRSGLPGRVLVLAATSTIGQRWTTEEACCCLKTLGAVVLTGADHTHDFDAILIVEGGVATDLRMIRAALAEGISVVVLAEGLRVRERVAFERIGCSVVPDFSSAIYQAAWESIRSPAPEAAVHQSTLER